MRSMSTHPDLITTAEAADLLGRSVATVNRWADDGKLPHAHKIDGLRGPRLFRRDDVLALVRPQPTEAAS